MVTLSPEQQEAMAALELLVDALNASERVASTLLRGVSSKHALAADRDGINRDVQRLKKFIEEGVRGE